MVSMIEPAHGDHILEPCGGDGMFIDALLENTIDLNIDTCDIDKNAINILKSKYSECRNISIREADTLFDEIFDEYSRTGYYDKIIGNPPYGGWQEYERRAELKQRYKGFYVKETYSLFLLRCISLLKEKGVLSFIIPDTFLYLHNHKQLRRYLLNHTLIKELAIFPGSFFPGVSFGYSNLCIITVQKESSTELRANNRFIVAKGMKTDKDLSLLSLKNNLPNDIIRTLNQNDLLKNQDCAFFFGDEQTRESIVTSKDRLGDIADCVTGIYCGDNKRFLAVEQNNKREVKGYSNINEHEINYSHLSTSPIEMPQKYIPIVKGSSSTAYFRTADKWVIEWTASALFHYNSDPKARFQNSNYYFRRGIALPMVKSAKIKATLMDGNVFDQSIVGIFPHNEKYILYILALLNSEMANECIHIINPTANNSANYLKKLPVYIPTESELSKINERVSFILESKDVNIYQNYIDAFFRSKMQNKAA
jgi:tRNA1(Val) A37 N6-methylase TrmN6